MLQLMPCIASPPFAAPRLLLPKQERAQVPNILPIQQGQTKAGRAAAFNELRVSFSFVCFNVCLKIFPDVPLCLYR
jgi:hypothetical protein